MGLQIAGNTQVQLFSSVLVSALWWYAPDPNFAVSYNFAIAKLPEPLNFDQLFQT